MKLMDSKQLRDWLDSEEFICEATRVYEDMTYDQDFNERRKG